MDWEKGYSASTYIMVVDPITWKDLSRIDITGGKVSKKLDSELRESADIDCVAYDQTEERWIRVYMDVRQDGAAEHVALFTGLAASPDRDINGVLSSNNVQCYSVLKPAQDVLLPRGWYVSAGSDGARVAADLLSVTAAPKVVQGSAPTLQETIIAEDDESNLSMALKILEAVNWRIRISGDGTIQIMPQATGVSAMFDYLEHDMIEPKIKVTYDWFTCPNVFRAIADDMMAIARDDDPDSPLSTVRRGREIWAQDTSCDLNDGETVAEYSLRKLKELQAASQEVSYDRRFHPDVLPSDLVRIKYPGQGIDGVYMSTDQTINLEQHGATSEDGVRYE